MTKEQRFYNALKDIFVGAKVEGESGYINLMRIKSRYYENGVFPRLQDDVEKALKPFPEFREELFDKLYTFFHRYFSESGSIYFRYTPLHQNIYEKVYTDDKDVMLFYKTHMLYYVKSDRLFKNLEVEIPRQALPDTPLKKGNIDGYKFFFDVSTLEHKKANEKRETIYELKEIRKDKVISFNVYYTEKGRTTKTDDIMKALKKQKVAIDEAVLEQAFRVFEKQSEVDYFINKNAKEFLREQFNIWLYQYVFSGESEWNEKRIKQLQTLKDIAFKIIDFISQFEDELVKIWNKPKFVLNSNYVITLDRIANACHSCEGRNPYSLIEKILKHRNIKDQIKEWLELGIVDENFKVESVFENSPLKKGWQTEGLTGYLKLPYNPKLKERARKLRKAGNLSEVLLWNKLKQGQMAGFDFTRQQVIGNYIVDFHCPQLNLVIEIDGESHDFKGEYDEERNRYLQSLGLTVLHFKDIDIKKSLNEVLVQIEDWIKENTPSLRDTPLEKGNNTPSASQTPLLLKGEFKHLPIDTKYFKDLELEILGLFDDGSAPLTTGLDNALDGWLIHSENYQALNTILPKFKGKVQTIYIDPPFNKEHDADYFYSVKYKDASWITLLENRLQLAKDVLRDTGSIFVRCDYNGNMYVRLLMNEFFGEENFRNEIVVKRGAPKSAMFEQFAGVKSIGVMYNNLLWYSSNPDVRYQGFKVSIEKKGGYWSNFYDMKPSGERPTMRYELFGLLPPKNYYWKWGKERGTKAVENYKQYLEIAKSTGETLEEYFLRTGIGDFVKLNKEAVKYWVRIREEDFLVNNWLDIPGYSAGWGFKTENSEILLKRVIESTSSEGDLCLDFFLGSGTTTAVAHKLGRKWLGIEMGEHFYTVVLPRMKKVLAYDKSGVSREIKEYQGGGFFKYYDLEQYEDTLRKVNYEDSDLFENPSRDPYNQYIFLKDLKLLEAIEIDYKKNKVKVDLNRLYDGIDIPETLSNLLGKWIKKITPEYVEFENGEKIDLKNFDYKLIKPLIWW